MTNSRRDLVPRPPRTAQPPRRRPVAGTRGRKPSADPTAASPVADPTEPGAADTVDERAEAVVSEPITAKASGLSTRPKPRPAPSPAPKLMPSPGPAPARDAGEAEEGQAARAGRGRRMIASVTRSWLVISLALVTVLLLAATGVLGWNVLQARRTADAGKAALPSARSHAKEILSYDYNRIDADIARAKKDITGSFKSEYADTSKVVKPLALQYHVVVVATIKAASVVSASPDKVVVLLFVDQKTTSTRIAGPKTDQSRVRMTLVKTGGAWLVAKVDAL